MIDNKSDDESVKRQKELCRRKKWREANREKLNAQAKAYRDRNKDKVRERNRIARLTRDKRQHAETMREWRKKNPESAKSADLKKCYGIGIEEYKRMLEDQKGVCAICSAKPLTKALAVDHNHATGSIRGLLCGNCNRAIGFANEDKAILLSMIHYLNKWS